MISKKKIQYAQKRARQFSNKAGVVLKREEENIKVIIKGQ